jgi:hypothetical protein
MAPVAGPYRPAVKRRATGLGDLRTDVPIICGDDVNADGVKLRQPDEKPDFRSGAEAVDRIFT